MIKYDVEKKRRHRCRFAEWRVTRGSTGHLSSLCLLLLLLSCDNSDNHFSSTDALFLLCEGGWMVFLSPDGKTEFIFMPTSNTKISMDLSSIILFSCTQSNMSG